MESTNAVFPAPPQRLSQCLRQRSHHCLLQLRCPRRVFEQKRAKDLAKAFGEEHTARLHKVFDKCDNSGVGKITKLEPARPLHKAKAVLNNLNNLGG